MAKKNPVREFFIGIDIAKEKADVCIIPAVNQPPIARFVVTQNISGMKDFSSKLNELFRSYTVVERVYFCCESTGIYSVNLMNFIYNNFHYKNREVYVYQVNAVQVKNFKRMKLIHEKTDKLDAQVIANYIAVDHSSLRQYHGYGFIALKFLVRMRHYLRRAIASYENKIQTTLFLQVSEMSRINNVLTDNQKGFLQYMTANFDSLNDIKSLTDNRLYEIINSTSAVPSKKAETIKLLKSIIAESYKIDNVTYESLQLTITQMQTVIKTMNRQINDLDEVIEKYASQVNPQMYTILKSIPGIGPVFAADFISEVPDMTFIENNGQLASYAGLTWPVEQSGSKSKTYMYFSAPIKTACNRVLRSYLCNITVSVVQNCVFYKRYFDKKMAEAKTNNYKRALLLTARKLVKLIFALCKKNKLYSSAEMRRLSMLHELHKNGLTAAANNFTMVDKEGNLINKDGNKIDFFGNIINEPGDKKIHVNKQVNSEGNPIEVNILEKIKNERLILQKADKNYISSKKAAERRRYLYSVEKKQLINFQSLDENETN